LIASYARNAAGQNRRMKITPKRTSALRVASIARSASARSIVIGFSTMVCLPRAVAIIVAGTWNGGFVQTEMASTPWCSISARASPQWFGMPNSRASDAARSGSMSAQPTNSHSPSASRAAQCFRNR
jgi:hypothetical protein